jgi:hypothetical protein
VTLSRGQKAPGTPPPVGEPALRYRRQRSSSLAVALDRDVAPAAIEIDFHLTLRHVLILEMMLTHGAEAAVKALSDHLVLTVEIIVERVASRRAGDSRRPQHENPQGGSR